MKISYKHIADCLNPRPDIKELSEKVALYTGYKGQIIWDTSKPDGTPQKKLDISRIKKS